MRPIHSFHRPIGSGVGSSVGSSVGRRFDRRLGGSNGRGHSSSIGSGIPGDR